MTTKPTGIDRRDLLKGLGFGAAGAAALTAAPTAEAAETPQEQVKQRYAETDHIKRFYALNRL
ncbi:twin-arginine translocation signal domain-containing protein [Azospirillum sp. TSO22-1]|uniref:twin-arginine translocation signal domain-containing protein n=1 Tax=Azospirillum sp. TSO22-1 TaxID=716789 RepID=UPI000D608E45|nr:twin-arginine translocation signal domain-containing protein [Azospirillum sp. TSO22-1]PWC36948.1 hypothetical protein TSO221_28555 [Azospirillum sp. TSO22-1]